MGNLCGKPVSPPVVYNHMAVRRDGDIVVFGGFGGIEMFPKLPISPLKDNRRAHMSEIYIYNLENEFWKEVTAGAYEIPPPTANAVAVAIGNDIYMHGGTAEISCYAKCALSAKVQHNPDITEYVSTAVWKLSPNGKTFTWSPVKVSEENLSRPSPRERHSGWEHENKLWIFGGRGRRSQSPGYLYDHGMYKNGANNQLHSFDPMARQWNNVECHGNVPSPRYAHASTQRGDEVYVYGGIPVAEDDDLYCLDMESLAWTQISTLGPAKPLPNCGFYTLATISDHWLVLHGGSYQTPRLLDLDSNTWEDRTADQDTEVRGHTSTAGLGYAVVVIGGRSTKKGGFVNKLRTRVATFELRDFSYLYEITEEESNASASYFSSSFDEYYEGELGLCPSLIAAHKKEE